MSLPITGLNLSLQSGTNKIDITNGVGKDSTDNVNISIPVDETRTIDPTTTGVGGLDEGTLQPDSRYAVWVMRAGQNVGALMSLSFDEAGVTWPSANAKRRRVGSVITDSNGDIKPFVQAGSGNDRDVSWQLDMLEKAVVHDEEEANWKFRDYPELCGPVCNSALLLLKPSAGATLHVREANTGGGPLISVSSETTWQFTVNTGAERMEFRTTNGPGTVYVLGFRDNV